MPPPTTRPTASRARASRASSCVRRLGRCHGGTNQSGAVDGRPRMVRRFCGRSGHHAGPRTRRARMRRRRHHRPCERHSQVARAATAWRQPGEPRHSCDSSSLPRLRPSATPNPPSLSMTYVIRSLRFVRMQRTCEARPVLLLPRQLRYLAVEDPSGPDAAPIWISVTSPGAVHGE